MLTAPAGQPARPGCGLRQSDHLVWLYDNAKILLFGSRFTPALRRNESQRQDVELIDLERLYTGS